MCGRVYVKTSLAEMVAKFGFADAGTVGALDNTFRLNRPTVAFWSYRRHRQAL